MTWAKKPKPSPIVTFTHKNDQIQIFPIFFDRNYKTFKYVLSTMGVSKESISKFLIGNRFHVKLRILSPENCKQSLQVKSWKAQVTAEKKNKLKTTIEIS